MVSGSRRYLWAAAAALVTAVAVYLGTGLAPLPALTWWAPLPALLLAPRVSAKLAAATAFVGWFAGQANLWQYLLRDLGLPPVALGFLALNAAIFVAAVLLFRALVRRKAFVRAALAAPAVWAAGDYLVALVSPHGAFGSLATTQIGVLPVAQFASLTGAWGISFLLFVPAAALAATLAPGAHRRAVLQVASAAAVLVVGVLGYGVVRLATPPSSQTVRIAISSADTADDARWSTPGGKKILATYGEQVAAAARDGAKVVVLPEKILDVQFPALPELTEQFQRLANEQGVELVVGLTVFGDHGNDYNRALVLYPDGRAPASYDKHHLIPGEEPYTPGTKLGLLAEQWGVLICKDLDFPSLVRQYGRAGTNLLLVPALDFSTDGRLHSRIAMLRGIENGIPIARNGSRGLLVVSDAFGRVVAERSAPRLATASLMVDVTPGIHRTLYSQWGDAFGQLCVVLALLLLASLTVRRRPTGETRHRRQTSLAVPVG